MSTGHIPTLSEIVDQMTVLRETTRDQGEYEAVTAAMRVLEDYALAEHRTTGWIDRVIRHIAGKSRKAAA